MAELIALTEIEKNRPTSIILTGLPGSGKSYLVYQFEKKYKAETCSADSYFYNANGEYVFDKHALGTAHLACQKKYNYLISNGKSAIVDNTNTTANEIKTYIILSDDRSNILMVRPNWTNELFIMNNNKKSWNIDFLLKHGIHNVPRPILERMDKRYIWDYSSLLKK